MKNKHTINAIIIALPALFIISCSEQKKEDAANDWDKTKLETKNEIRNAPAEASANTHEVSDEWKRERADFRADVQKRKKGKRDRNMKINSTPLKEKTTSSKPN